MNSITSANDSFTLQRERERVLDTHETGDWVVLILLPVQGKESLLLGYLTLRLYTIPTEPLSLQPIKYK